MVHRRHGSQLPDQTTVAWGSFGEAPGRPLFLGWLREPGSRGRVRLTGDDRGRDPCAAWETSASLLVGIGLNTMFLLGGEPNPSVFYIVIQLTLLWGAAGAFYSLDARSLQRSAQWRPAVSADPSAWFKGRPARVMMFCAVVLGLMSAPFIQTLEPANVIEDPAAVGTFCALLAALPYGLHRSAARSKAKAPQSVPYVHVPEKPLSREARAQRQKAS